MSYIHIIRDATGKRVFNVVTENADAKVTVIGLPGATVTTEEHDMDKFITIESEQFPGRNAHLLLGGEDTGAAVLNHASTSKIEFPGTIEALAIEFRSTEQ